MGMRFQPHVDEAMALPGFWKEAKGASREHSPSATSAASDSTCSPAWSSDRSSDSELSGRSMPEPVRFGFVAHPLSVWVVPAPAPLQQVPLSAAAPPTLQQAPPSAAAPPPEAPRSAAEPLPEDARAAPWRLVWCNEHCHKTEATAQRKRLFRSVVEKGGTLLCLKKAEKVAAWVNRGWCTEPWLLLTDWREAKPLLEALAMQPQDRQPLCTMILADGPRQFERAAAWLQDGLPCSRGARVFRDEAAVLAFVGEVLASRAAGAAQQRSSPGSPQMAAAAACPAPQAAASAACPVPQPQAFVEPPGTEVLSPLRRGHSSTELEHLLRSAMPECYED